MARYYRQCFPAQDWETIALIVYTGMFHDITYILVMLLIHVQRIIPPIIVCVIDCGVRTMIHFIVFK